MRLQSRIDGTPRDAELHLARGKAVLLVDDRQGQQVCLGPLTAALGYELIRATPTERRQLEAAGYHVPLAGRHDAIPQALAVLRERRDPPSDPGGSPHILHRSPLGRRQSEQQS